MMMIEGLRWRTTLVTGLVTTVVSWLLSRWWVASGERVVQTPWLAAALLVVMALALLVVAWPMRRYRREGTAVAPLRAARILGLAQAGALTGAVVCGLYLGHALVLLPDLGFGSHAELALRLGAAALAGALVAVAGHVAQGWCRIRDEDRSDPAEGSPGRR
ncbi:hypothetical protein AWH69_05725 [Janibacter melonis]|uniref:DUF3180 family protein n=1 Tax=Janibacter melonis TaxID=262209 RepID=A0A176QD07_9MICO|nr:DUF3180 family protein [Janibacter melonis]MBD5829720.1 DUF3180 domain-containing protein [Janibacter melonis]OAB87562.1 hypothetical protein AWH69_05725 [Janibacter melonis]